MVYGLCIYICICIHCVIYLYLRTHFAFTVDMISEFQKIKNIKTMGTQKCLVVAVVVVIVVVVVFAFAFAFVAFACVVVAFDAASDVCMCLGVFYVCMYVCVYVYQTLCLYMRRWW